LASSEPDEQTIEVDFSPVRDPARMAVTFILTSSTLDNDGH
jgi:hypothetical protein